MLLRLRRQARRRFPSSFNGIPPTPGECGRTLPQGHQLDEMYEWDDDVSTFGRNPDLGFTPDDTSARDRGLGTLVVALTARRALLHDAFVQRWSKVIEDGLRPRLEAALDEADHGVAG
jgi:hypothetical protein